ncbi:hypothetical protein GGTG_11881 [Gaeumannomyces tritici R3-111a-1]|uniref:Uncharacterized protein n=1 Tax=Gaeumannomyces tritici (strain R3-111a-1) TaxID=644352 RepID=J3PEF0_GAET3|nr:hypothetical protein GGTG_11881 [Gaeumannomyces tritici R3-111a-1]EJT70858.1 hypothetical protein GGTG_11881 [Gaeumannomyces tritici R3-111a-1]
MESSYVPPVGKKTSKPPRPVHGQRPAQRPSRHVCFVSQPAQAGVSWQHDAISTLRVPAYSEATVSWEQAAVFLLRFAGANAEWGKALPRRRAWKQRVWLTPPVRGQSRASRARWRLTQPRLQALGSALYDPVVIFDELDHSPYCDAKSLHVFHFDRGPLAGDLRTF